MSSPEEKSLNLPAVQNMPLLVELACGEGMNNRQIGEKLGVSQAQVTVWLRDPAVKAAISQFYATLTEEVSRLPIANKAMRIRDMQAILDKQDVIIDDRAKLYESNQAGGRSGLIVKQVKTIGSGKDAYDVAEWVYDTALVKDRLALYKQAAQELGQFSEKSTVDVTVTEQVKVIQFVEQIRRDLDVVEAEVREIDGQSENDLS